MKQAEDELAAIHMAIGASFAGVRSMTATSGGGFCLMVEALGMAGMTETPVVVVDSQRAGPSTGLPTKTEQGDLNLMLGAGQSEFPRAILAPSEPHEAYAATVEAFRLAEEWQTPILLASDLHLSENFATVDREELPLSVELPVLVHGPAERARVLRYQYTASGVSPRAIPGQPGLQFIAGSDEHDEKGHLISDVKAGIPRWVSERKKMMDKRMHKLFGLLQEPPVARARRSRGRAAHVRGVGFDGRGGAGRDGRCSPNGGSRPTSSGSRRSIRSIRTRCARPWRRPTRPS